MVKRGLGNWNLCLSLYDISWGGSVCCCVSSGMCG